jgi:hypothetical protein
MARGTVLYVCMYVCMYNVCLCKLFRGHNVSVQIQRRAERLTEIDMPETRQAGRSWSPAGAMGATSGQNPTAWFGKKRGLRKGQGPLRGMARAGPSLILRCQQQKVEGSKFAATVTWYWGPFRAIHPAF